MSDMLGIGASGINAYNAALAVVGDNVANADTPGYVRRKVALRVASPTGAGDPTDRGIGTGSGVRIGSVTRAYDAIRTAAALDAGSDLARLDTRGAWLTRLQSTLGTGAASLDKRLGGFFDAAQDLGASPASPAARTIFLDRADATAAAFRSTSSGLDGLTRDIAAATAQAVDDVNRITANLAEINTLIRRSQGSGAAANALLDARDGALAELASFVRIDTTETDGVVEVRLGDGPNAAVLVRGGSATRIGVEDGPAGADLVLDPTNDRVAVRLPASGSLAGLVEAGRRVAATAVAIDGLADRFAAAANAQHITGVDAAGADGEALFATRTLVIDAGAANAGEAAVDVRIADGATIADDGYVLGFDGTAWSLARGDGSGTVTGAGALVLDGVTVMPSGAARAGDRFVLAARDGAAGIALRPLAPAEVAAASRWLGDAGGANTGGGRLTVVVDPAAAGLPTLPEYRIVVTAAGTADIIDPATATVIGTATLDGSRIAGAGFAFTLAGAAAVGDSFRITRNAGGAGDNGNVRALAALRGVAGAGGTIEAALDATVAGVASSLSETAKLAASATAVRDDAARAADAVGGVDLDQEAAELTRLQAAYRANAQVIAAAREMFDTLLGAVR